MKPAELKRLMAGQPGFWEHWGFSPWRDGSLAGVVRKQRFVKDGFLGPIAEYGAMDYIVWECGDEEKRQNLWRALKPLPEVMTQRFLFILPDPWPERRIRSFWLGFKGYVEFYAYWPAFISPAHEAPPDLSGLVDLALVPCPDRDFRHAISSHH